MSQLGVERTVGRQLVDDETCRCGSCCCIARARQQLLERGMGEPFEAIARLLELLLATAGLATGLAAAPALLGQVELAGVEETEAIFHGKLATRAACLRRGLADGSLVGFGVVVHRLRSSGWRTTDRGFTNRSEEENPCKWAWSRQSRA